jgi:acyl-CoA synthetase (AMP-forming)/AMP-acid ligase II
MLLMTTWRQAGGITWDGSVGGKVRTRLLDVPEMGYSRADTPFPRGELCVSNSQLSVGYLDDPEKTAEAFFEDEAGTRWYRTGDICELRGVGSLGLSVPSPFCTVWRVSRSTWRVSLST